jgi:hypothetical protein
MRAGIDHVGFGLAGRPGPDSAHLVADMGANFRAPRWIPPARKGCTGC